MTEHLRSAHASSSTLDSVDLTATTPSSINANKDELKEEIFESIKSKLAEIECIEAEMQSMYGEVHDLQLSQKAFKSKCIEQMKIDITKCFADLEAFIKDKRNAMLLKVNNLSQLSSVDEQVNIDLTSIKQENDTSIATATQFLQDKMADYELMQYSQDTLLDIDSEFMDHMDRLNVNIVSINKLIDTASVKQSYRFEENASIYKQLLNNVVNVAAIQSFVPSKDGDLLVKKGQRCELKSNYQYEFGNIVLQEDSKLTVNAWSRESKNGGVLFIKCLNRCVLEKKSRITVSYKGYKGGANKQQGESFNKIGIDSPGANDGGGGVGVSGGGGAYAKSGMPGKHSQGGDMYGDKELTDIYMGSGGGASEKCHGGNGGGALWLYCLADIELKEEAFIFANGMQGFDAKLLEKGGGGGGSGGSIYVECNQLKLSSTSNISACGGGGGKPLQPFGHHGGAGTEGRICIKVKGQNSIAYVQNIKPKPCIVCFR